MQEKRKEEDADKAWPIHVCQVSRPKREQRNVTTKMMLSLSLFLVIFLFSSFLIFFIFSFLVFCFSFLPCFFALFHANKNIKMLHLKGSPHQYLFVLLVCCFCLVFQIPFPFCYLCFSFGPTSPNPALVCCYLFFSFCRCFPFSLLVLCLLLLFFCFFLCWPNLCEKG